MEPRPLNKPQRSNPPPPAPGVPPADRGSWVPPAPPPAPSHTQPFGQPNAAYPSGGFDASPNRGPWHEPPGVADPPQPPHGYSPGPALTPIDGGRGSRLLGPILALVVLAAVVISVVFVIVRVFDDGGGNTTANQPGGSGTTVAQAAASNVATEEPSPVPTQSGGVVAGADEAAADGSAAPEPTSTTQQDGAQPTKSSPASARSMLPSSSELSDGFERTEDDKRAQDAVASSFANPDEALVNLEQWDWRENAYRTFEIPAGSNPDPNGATVINVSIHRFGKEQGAKDALNYFADDVIATQGLEEFEVERIGEQTRGLKGATDGANLVVLYVRTGNYLIRIGGTSPQGDPTADVIAIAKKIVE